MQDPLAQLPTLLQSQHGISDLEAWWQQWQQCLNIWGGQSLWLLYWREMNIQLQYQYQLFCASPGYQGFDHFDPQKYVQEPYIGLIPDMHRYAPAIFYFWKDIRWKVWANVLSPFSWLHIPFGNKSPESAESRSIKIMTKDTRGRTWQNLPNWPQKSTRCWLCFLFLINLVNSPCQGFELDCKPPSPKPDNQWNQSLVSMWW